MDSEQKVILVTGVTGFVGQQMVQHLTQFSYEVVGVARAAAARLPAALKRNLTEYISCDFTNQAAVDALIREIRPTYVLHLAGQANAAKAWQAPLVTCESNAAGTLNLLEAIRKYSSATKRIVSVGSSHEYTLVSSPPALVETMPTVPASPYGWSKLLQTTICQMYAKSFALPVIVARTFNLIGPGARQGVFGQLINDVVKLEKNHALKNEIQIGNTQIERDFLDVRDAVRAFLLLAISEQPASGQVYNVCSGQSQSIQTLLDCLQQASKRSFHTAVNEVFIRPNEPQTIVGDPGQLQQATGWQRQINLTSSVLDALQFARCLK
ncbi:GDP-mannose 4,6-dehydratase [Alicyclobacillus fodiniaquatilis]|uniref:GDP-mannose 4,6-dehydratase n=1 Tax=Alicyclobacillus fodiniaquatilis TaxID=1661150 RepID=A0ABW4JIC8_9BACL